VLQPIVENAIKHGVSQVRDGGIVRIRADVTGETGAERLRLTVADSGPGVNPSDLADRRLTGVGLSNIERRLFHYFGAEGTLEIISSAGAGTTVVITMPLRLRPRSRAANQVDSSSHRVAS
jgi:two-component system sensor histidine kinase LytS